MEYIAFFFLYMYIDIGVVVHPKSYTVQGGVGKEEKSIRTTGDTETEEVGCLLTLQGLLFDIHYLISANNRHNIKYLKSFTTHRKEKMDFKFYLLSFSQGSNPDEFDVQVCK